MRYSALLIAAFASDLIDRDDRRPWIVCSTAAERMLWSNSAANQ
jgi:hypothetical protein